MYSVSLNIKFGRLENWKKGDVLLWVHGIGMARSPSKNVRKQSILVYEYEICLVAQPEGRSNPPVR